MSLDAGVAKKPGQRRAAASWNAAILAVANQQHAADQHRVVPRLPVDRP
jgi:hypothetical protein